MTALIERTEAVVTATPTTMPIRSITVHPQYRRRDLGKLRDLQQSIRKDGLTRPIPVTADGMLIAGERRLRACRNLGWERIPVTVATDDAHAVQLLAAELADTGPGHKPPSVTELTLAGMYIEDFRRGDTEKRREAGRRGRSLESAPRSQSVAAAAIGMPHHYYSQIKPIVMAHLGTEAVVGGYSRTQVEPEWSARSGEALALLDRVYAGERVEHETPTGRRQRLTINAIYAQWTTERSARRNTSVENNSSSNGETAIPVRHRAQREALLKGLASLNGLCNGLAEITEIDPAVTSEESAALDRDLSRASQVLRGLRLKIKEHANGID